MERVSEYELGCARREAGRARKVGRAAGCDVGSLLGNTDGCDVGSLVGDTEGCDVGSFVGDTEGCDVGSLVGDTEGCDVGLTVVALSCTKRSASPISSGASPRLVVLPSPSSPCEPELGPGDSQSHRVS